MCPPYSSHTSCICLPMRAGPDRHLFARVGLQKRWQSRSCTIYVSITPIRDDHHRNPSFFLSLDLCLCLPARVGPIGVKVQQAWSSTVLGTVAIAGHGAATCSWLGTIGERLAAVCTPRSMLDWSANWKRRKKKKGLKRNKARSYTASHAVRVGGIGGHLQHSPPYSTPAKVYPAALHPDVQAATVICALATLPSWYVNARPVVPSLPIIC